MITSDYGRSASDTPHLARQQLSCSLLAVSDIPAFRS